MAKVLQKSDLAINGGKPVHTKPWRTGPFHFSAEVAVLKKLLSGPALPLARGRAVMAYREALQQLYGMDYAIPTSSGSTAIHVALFAAGVGAGDEAYRPGRLKKGFYPLDLAPNAMTAGERLASIQTTQHNTVSEARAAIRAVRKVASALLGKAL